MDLDSVDLSWHDVSLTLPRSGSKVILDNVSGSVASGCLTAIMGPSGSGKTSLLSLLGGKLVGHKDYQIQGSYLANGQAYNRKKFGSFGAFVFQNDILFQNLTVRETITFTAQLRCPGTPQQILEKVDKIIQDFQLSACQHTFIGGNFVKGISGGEKKRTNVACELVVQPKVILLDQPTSGLDSYTAEILVGVLKRFSADKTVLMTIHQPSSKILCQFDKLIVLNEGRTVYAGPTLGIVSYLKELGVVMPDKTNPADFFMLKLKGSEGVLTHQNYQLRLKDKECPPGKPGQLPTRNKQGSFWGQVQILYRRGLTEYVRNKMMLTISVANSIFMALLLGSIFWQVDDSRPKDGSPLGLFQAYVFEVLASGFVCITSLIMNGLFGVVMSFAVEREIFSKEYSSCAYSVLGYYLSKLLVILPSVVLLPALFAASVYFMIGFSADPLKFFSFVCSCVLVNMAGNSLGLMTGCLFKDSKKATIFAPIFLLPFMVFSGLYSNQDSILSWASWLQYISPFRYGMLAVFQSEMAGAVLKYEYNGQIMEITDPANFFFGFTASFQQAHFILLGLSVLFYSLAYVFLRILAKGNI